MIARLLPPAVILLVALPLSVALGEPPSVDSPALPDRPLIVGTKVVKPFSFRDADGQWTGISIDLWEEIATRRGWEWEWREAANTNELVERVASGEMDVGIAAITMKPSRAEMVDFSNSVFQAGVGIAVRSEAPGALSLVTGVISWRFLGPVLGLCAILLGVGAVIWLLERRANPDMFEPEARRGLWSGFWWSAVTMTTVGYGDKVPRSVGGRLLGLVWMYAGIIMISGFTAVVASSLTTRQLQYRIRSAEDLYEASVGAKHGESPAAILRERGIEPVEFDTIAAGLAALQAGDIEAFVHDRPVLRFELREDAALAEVVHILPDPLREEEYGIAVRPTEVSVRNLLREQINATVLEIKISGRYGEIQNEYLGRR